MKDHETFSGESFMALCRCGSSTYLPYCDGNHKGVIGSTKKEFASFSRKKAENIRLCRCGNSTYLPYCDGNH